MKLKNERLIREAVREILLEKVSGAVLQVGDVKKALELAKKKEKADAWKSAAVEAGKKASEKGLEAVIGMIPFGGTAWSAISAAKDISDIYSDTVGWEAEDKEQNPLWDFMTVDPATSELLDDKVEREFIKALGDKVEGMNDDAYVPNADDALEDYLTKYHDGHYVAKQ